MAVGSSFWLEQKAYVRVIRMESESICPRSSDPVKDFVYCCWGQGGSTIGNPRAEARHSEQYFEKTGLRVILGQPRVTCSNEVMRV